MSLLFRVNFIFSLPFTSSRIIEVFTAVLIDACTAFSWAISQYSNNSLVLGGGFPGIYSILLTDRCWSADGNGVILSTAWRSYKVGISYRFYLYTWLKFVEF